MTIKVHPYDVPANYSFDTAKIEVVGGVAKLKTVPSGDFTNNSNFTTSGDYTFDSAKVQFTAGKARLKDQRLPNNNLFAGFRDNLNGSYANVAGSILATVSAVSPTHNAGLGSADFTAGAYYLRYDNPASQIHQTLFSTNPSQWNTYRFLWRAGYTGNPAANAYFFGYANAFPTPTAWAGFYHHTGGTLRFEVDSQSMPIKTVVGPAFSPVSGTDYEIEVAVQFGQTATTIRVFVNGTYLGEFNITYAAIGDSIVVDKVWIGNIYTQAAASADGNFKDFSIFFVDVHGTASYTAPITQADTIYTDTGASVSMNTNILQEADPPGVSSITSIVAVEVNTGGDFITYNTSVDDGVTWLWYNSFTTLWEPSSGVAQSNSIAVLNANRNTIGVPTGDRLRFRVWLRSNTGATYPEIDNIETKHKKITYDLTDPTILTNEAAPAIDFNSFVAVETKPAGTEIKYQLFKGGSNFYWNGSTWVAGSGYAQANTAAVIAANIASFISETSAVPVKVLAFLHSDAGIVTPEIDSVTLDYVPDVSPPLITAVLPADSSSDIPISTTISITFNEAIAPVTAIGGNFFLKEGLNTVAMTGAPVLSNGDKTLTITPSAPLLSATAYVIHATNSLSDVGGVFFAGDTFDFATAVTPEPPPEKCLVFGQIMDAGGQPLESIDVTAIPVNSAETDTGFTFIPNVQVAVTTDENGTWSLYLVRSSELNPDQQYKISFRKRSFFQEYTITVPDTGTANFNTLI